MGLLKRIFPKKEKKETEKRKAEEPILKIGRDGSLRIEDIQLKKEEPSEAICPYCDKKLKPKPQRKKKCPFCGNTIYIRNGNLVTEEKADEIDKEREEERQKQLLEDQGEKFGFSVEEFQKREQEFSEKIGGAKPNQIDVIMSLFNEGIVKGKFKKTGIPYYEMALFLNENNKECFHLLQLAAKMELKEYQKQEFVTHVEISSGGGCPSCDKLDGKQMTIKEALETMPIPNKDCTFHLYDEKRAFCRCNYSPVVKEL